MPEGLSAPEVGHEIAEHAHDADGTHDTRGGRLRPGYRPAFDAWLATDPAHNPNAPPGPSYMPQYVIPQATAATRYDAAADAAFSKGTADGSTGDKYVRDTVFLATVLFLVGISGHFPVRQARYALVGVGTLLLVFSVVQLLELAPPPGS